MPYVYTEQGISRLSPLLNSNISTLDVQKLNKEYSILKIAKSDKFHDRFIIIDNHTLYHCGASIKDLGKKCFAISKMENKEIFSIIKNII